MFCHLLICMILFFRSLGRVSLPFFRQAPGVFSFPQFFGACDSRFDTRMVPESYERAADSISSLESGAATFMGRWAPVAGEDKSNLFRHALEFCENSCGDCRERLLKLIWAALITELLNAVLPAGQRSEFFYLVGALRLGAAIHRGQATVLEPSHWNDPIIATNIEQAVRFGEALLYLALRTRSGTGQFPIQFFALQCSPSISRSIWSPNAQII